MTQMIHQDLSKPDITRPRMAESTIHISKCDQLVHEESQLTQLRSYSEDGILSGHLDMPFGLNQLNNSLYGINGSVRLILSERSKELIRFSGHLKGISWGI
jgi:hypothetical protein